MRLIVVIKRGIIYITLVDNVLGSSFTEILPLEIELSRSGGHEYYAALTKALDTDDANLVSKVKNNGLYYLQSMESAFSKL